MVHRGRMARPQHGLALRPAHSPSRTPRRGSLPSYICLPSTSTTHLQEGVHHSSRNPAFHDALRQGRDKATTHIIRITNGSPERGQRAPIPSPVPLLLPHPSPDNGQASHTRARGVRPCRARSGTIPKHMNSTGGRNLTFLFRSPLAFSGMVSRPTMTSPPNPQTLALADHIDRISWKTYSVASHATSTPPLH